MASPKTMWSGPIELGLLNIPITLGKSFEVGKTFGIRQVDYDDAAATVDLIDRSERNARTGKRVANKQRAIELEIDGEQRWKILDGLEWNHIEEATKLKSLKALDVQPIKRLPMMYAFGTYYVRHDEKSKTTPLAFAVLMAALSKMRVGLVVKWGSESNQKLCVISAESGILVLRLIPFLDEIRVASSKERSHFKAEVSNSQVQKMCELLVELSNPKGFQYANYQDEGAALRQSAIERILDGNDLPEQIELSEDESPMDDILEMINHALEEAKA